MLEGPGGELHGVQPPVVGGGHLDDVQGPAVVAHHELVDDLEARGPGDGDLELDLGIDPCGDVELGSPRCGSWGNRSHSVGERAVTSVSPDHRGSGRGHRRS